MVSYHASFDVFSQAGVASKHGLISGRVGLERACNGTDQDMEVFDIILGSGLYHISFEVVILADRTYLLSFMNCSDNGG